jgi:hypothetical protein
MNPQVLFPESDLLGVEGHDLHEPDCAGARTPRLESTLLLYDGLHQRRRDLEDLLYVANGVGDLRLKR